MAMTMQDTKYNPSTPAFGKSLRRRFGFTLVSVVTAILLVFSALVGWYNYGQKEAELQRQLGQALKLAETSLPEAVWKLDHRSINDILRALLSNDAVVFARVLVDGQAVATQVKTEVEDKGPSDFFDGADYLVSGAAIRREEHQVGLLQIVMSKEAIYREIWATTLSVIGLLVLLIIAILCTSMVVLRHYIFRPLAMLEKSAKRIADGDLETRIDLYEDDEIGSLAATLRIMTRRLQESFVQLELKVRERTADLSRAKLAAEETSHYLAIVGAELQALLDNSPVGILFMDNKGLIKRANQEMEKITGYSSAELVGKTPRLLYATGGAYKNMTEKVMPILAKKGYCQKQGALQRKDGVEIICQLQGRVVPDEGGVEGIVWSVEDITNRIRMENELLKTKKQESINVLAGGIAHDFNNILFAVLGNISLAERLADESGPVREYLRAAQKAAIRAKDLTAKLITYASGAEPVKATVELPELVCDVTELVLSNSSSKVQCRYQVPDDLWTVSMDKEQISQVIVSLVQNAEQSMPEGGSITIGFANIELVDDQIAGLSPGRYVQIFLQDSGRGIKAEDLDKIFDPYFSTKEKSSSKGAGLGLAIVHSIINKHEGKITVESMPGIGTTFTLYLPVVSGVGERVAEKTAILPSGKGSVLVVDKDGGVRSEVSEMLLHMGYAAKQAHDSETAIRLYREGFEAGSPFVAVLLDMTIADDGGQATFAGLLAIDSQAKVIAVGITSAGVNSQDVHDQGYSGTIAVPYQLLELNRVMAAVTGRQSYSQTGNRP
jgi:PAS domain S-box-containing protein